MIIPPIRFTLIVLLCVTWSHLFAATLPTTPPVGPRSGQFVTITVEPPPGGSGGRSDDDRTPLLASSGSGSAVVPLQELVLLKMIKSCEGTPIYYDRQLVDSISGEKLLDVFAADEGERVALSRADLRHALHQTDEVFELIYAFNNGNSVCVFVSRELSRIARCFYAPEWSRSADGGVPGGDLDTSFGSAYTAATDAEQSESAYSVSRMYHFYQRDGFSPESFLLTIDTLLQHVHSRGSSRLAHPLVLRVFQVDSKEHHLFVSRAGHASSSVLETVAASPEAFPSPPRVVHAHTSLSPGRTTVGKTIAERSFVKSSDDGTLSINFLHQKAGSCEDLVRQIVEWARTEIPEFNESSVGTLRIDGTHILALTAVLYGAFPNLTSFSAQRCGIKEVAAEALAAPLITMSLAHNEIDSFDMSWLGGRARGSLNCVDLSYNRLRALPANLPLCTKLHAMSLIGNQIAEVSDAALDGVPALHRIALEQNPCEEYSGMRSLIATHHNEMAHFERLIGADPLVRAEEGESILRSTARYLLQQRWDKFCAQVQTSDRAILVAHQDDHTVSLENVRVRSLADVFINGKKVGVSPSTGATAGVYEHYDPETIFPTTDAGRRSLLAWLLVELRYFLKYAEEQSQPWLMLPLVGDEECLRKVASSIPGSCAGGAGLTYQQHLSQMLVAATKRLSIDDMMLRLTKTDIVHILRAHPEHGGYLAGEGRVCVAADASSAAAAVAKDFAAAGADFMLVPHRLAGTHRK